jgi:hypothetical protein
MHVDELFSINIPDGFMESGHSVGRISAYACAICGAFVARDYLVAHVDIHNKIEDADKEIYTLRSLITKDKGEW